MLSKKDRLYKTVLIDYEGHVVADSTVERNNNGHNTDCWELWRIIKSHRHVPVGDAEIYADLCVVEHSIKQFQNARSVSDWIYLCFPSGLNRFLTFSRNQENPVQVSSLRILLNFILFCSKHVGAVILVLGAYLLRPILSIRWGPIYIHRIGHAAFELAYAIHRKPEGIHLYWPVPSRAWCNSQIETMAKRSLFISDWIYLVASYEKRLFPKTKLYLCPPTLMAENPSREGPIELSGFFYKDTPLLRLSEHEDRMTWQLMSKRIGISPQDKFVCLSFLNTTSSSSFYEIWAPGWDNTQSFRNCDPQLFLTAIKELIDLGYWVFRLGKNETSHFPFEDPHFIDYAQSDFRTDLLDVWLCAKCEFLVTPDTGMEAVAEGFQKPIVRVNSPRVGHNFRIWSHQIGVPKYWVRTESDNYLCLSEMLEHDTCVDHDHISNGLAHRDLSELEIAEAVKEMALRLDGSWYESDDDKRLQKQYCAILQSSNYYKKTYQDGWMNPNFRIGANFLATNQEWFLN